jgi:hypothetical protein
MRGPAPRQRDLDAHAAGRPCGLVPSRECHAPRSRTDSEMRKMPAIARLSVSKVPAGPHWAIVEIARICQPSRLGILVPGATRPRCFPYQAAGSQRGKDPER